MHKCIYCSNEDFIVMVDKPDYAFLLPTSKKGSEWVRFPLLIGCCKHCGITTEMRLPDRDLLARIYGPHYSSYPSSATVVETEGRVQEFLSAFPKFPTAGTVLEIGSYDGRLLNVLKSF